MSSKEVSISFGKEDGYQILDSGDRTKFETGAVRDMRIGKGRTDLIPWDCSALAALFPGDMYLANIIEFYKTRDTKFLVNTMYDFSEKEFGNAETAILELSKHFEAGAEKYGEYNWQKGIPTHCYLDSAIRHYLKYKRGDTDERHDRAFLWNLICLIWTAENLPKCDDLGMKLSRKVKRFFSRLRLKVHNWWLLIKLWFGFIDDK